MKILLVEDDRELCESVKLQLELAGCETEICTTGQDGYYLAESQPYDVIILDRMLPQMDGITILQGLRRKKITTPVIITTALDGIHDRITGLDAGADDYLVKPYAVDELLARIRAVTRRPTGFRDSRAYHFSDLSLQEEQRELTGPSGTVLLSKREHALMAYLLRNPNQVLIRERIISYIWGGNAEVEEGNLDNYIYFLRRRLKSIQSAVQIKTIHGSGYRLEEGAKV